MKLQKISDEFTNVSDKITENCDAITEKVIKLPIYLYNPKIFSIKLQEIFDGITKFFDEIQKKWWYHRAFVKRTQKFVMKSMA